jgi:ubiquinol-cytochrome c reductase cytochrome c1 subunit
MNTISYAESIPVSLETVPVDFNNKASIQRGAALFAANCMSCHTLIYLRYDELAKKAGITYEKMPVNTKWPAGAVPPDLSLEADRRGVDWIYTYLHSFYTDPSRPTGVNNLLVSNTMMPGILVAFQGQQIKSQDGPDAQTLYAHTLEWYDVLTLQKQGAMTPTQFDNMVIDIVSFLNYAAEPFHDEQVKLGKKVIGFLAIFFVLVYLLKREYWKDVKKIKS